MSAAEQVALVTAGAVTVALVVVSGIETWLLCRVVRRVEVLGRIDERVSSLAHTIALLTDTTEACFNAVAAQLQTTASPRPARTRASKQRRVVEAASHGRSVAEIAAAEELAESEVRLVLHLAQPAMGMEDVEHGAMRS